MFKDKKELISEKLSNECPLLFKEIYLNYMTGLEFLRIVSSHNNLTDEEKSNYLSISVEVIVIIRFFLFKKFLTC